MTACHPEGKDVSGLLNMTACHSEARSAEESIVLTEMQDSTNAKGFIYIVTNKNKTTLYVGVTSNLKKRIWEHKNHVVKGFTDKYNCENLVYFECFLDIKDAIEREKYIKGKKRVFKENLINEINPKWIDLYDYLFTDVSHSLNMTSHPEGKDVSGVLNMTACHSEGKDVSGVLNMTACHSEGKDVSRLLNMTACHFEVRSTEESL